MFSTTNNCISYNIVWYYKQMYLLKCYILQQTIISPMTLFLLQCCILQQTTMFPTMLYGTINNGVSYSNHVQYVSYNKQPCLLQCNTQLYLLKCCILKHIALSPTMFYLTTKNSIPYLMQANVLTQHMKALHTENGFLKRAQFCWGKFSK